MLLKMISIHCISFSRLFTKSIGPTIPLSPAAGASC